MPWCATLDSNEYASSNLHILPAVNSFGPSLFFPVKTNISLHSSLSVSKLHISYHPQWPGSPSIFYSHTSIISYSSGPFFSISCIWDFQLLTCITPTCFLLPFYWCSYAFFGTILFFFSFLTSIPRFFLTKASPLSSCNFLPPAVTSQLPTPFSVDMVPSMLSPTVRQSHIIGN